VPKEWLDHRHHRTYEIALGITRLVSRSGDMGKFEFLDDSITDFLLPWQEVTAVHQFARLVAYEMFLQDTEGPYIRGNERDGSGNLKPQRYLPVDCALLSYGLVNVDEIFLVPPRDGEWVKDRDRNIRSWQESSKVEDACYEYTRYLQLTGVYEELIGRLGEEVFHTIFPNRALLGRIHEILSFYVRGKGPDFFAENPEFAHLFEDEGVLKRVDPPKWVRDAVFFRDRGCCVMCGRDQTGLMDPQAAPHLDHIVPLEFGGLNDLSNMQLLCAACNGRKGDDLIPASTLHKRYYEPPRRRGSTRRPPVG
jgi:HNH endonuclease